MFLERDARGHAGILNDAIDPSWNHGPYVCRRQFIAIAHRVVWCTMRPSTRHAARALTASGASRRGRAARRPHAVVEPHTRERTVTRAGARQTTRMAEQRFGLRGTASRVSRRRGAASPARRGRSRLPGARTTSRSVPAPLRSTTRRAIWPDGPACPTSSRSSRWSPGACRRAHRARPRAGSAAQDVGVPSRSRRLRPELRARRALPPSLPARRGPRRRASSARPWDDVAHLAVGVDDERRACVAHVGAAVHRLLDPHAVRLGDRVVRVGQQREARARTCRGTS